jgi:hypothetical protein
LVTKITLKTKEQPMRDYWLTQDLLKAAGIGFIALSLLGIGLVLWLPKKWWGKLIALIAVGFLISIPVRKGTQEVQQQQVQVDQYKERLVKAQVMFAERCKTVGEKIHKTVDNVEGVYLMKVRPEGTNFGDQFKLDDPYGRDLGGDSYIKSLLRGNYLAGRDIQIPVGYPPRVGFNFVDAQDPKDGQRYRYTGGMKVVGQMDATAPNVQVDLKRNPNFDLNIYSFVMDRIPAPGKPPRYGVTYDDISTHEEREYWIAGSSLKVIDLQTNEVVAERTGYMVDWAQGSRAGQRSPWLFAADNACPDFFRNYKNLPASQRNHAASWQSYQTLDFVEKVLKPTK